jgi:hypothetical protein
MRWKIFYGPIVSGLELFEGDPDGTSRSFPFLVCCPQVRNTCSFYKAGGSRVANHPAGYSRNCRKPVPLPICISLPFVWAAPSDIPAHRPSSCLFVRKSHKCAQDSVVNEFNFYKTLSKLGRI